MLKIKWHKFLISHDVMYHIHTWPDMTCTLPDWSRPYSTWPSFDHGIYPRTYNWAYRPIDWHRHPLFAVNDSLFRSHANLLLSDWLHLLKLGNFSCKALHTADCPSAKHDMFSSPDWSRRNLKLANTVISWRLKHVHTVSLSLIFNDVTTFEWSRVGGDQSAIVQGV